MGSIAVIFILLVAFQFVSFGSNSGWRRMRGHEHNAKPELS